MSKAPKEDQRYVWDSPDFVRYLDETKQTYWALAASSSHEDYLSNIPAGVVASRAYDLGMLAIVMSRLAACGVRVSRDPVLFSDEDRSYYERRHAEWLQKAANHFTIHRAAANK